MRPSHSEHHDPFLYPLTFISFTRSPLWCSQPFLDFSLSKGGLAGLTAVQIVFAVFLTVLCVALALLQFRHVYRHGLLAYYLLGYGLCTSL